MVTGEQMSQNQQCNLSKYATLTSNDKSEPAEESGSMIEVDLGPSSDQSSQSGNDDIVLPDNSTCQS